MLIQKIMDIFDKYDELHVDVNDVRDRLLQLGVQDRILFHYVKMDSGRIRGLLHRYKTSRAPYAEPTLCSDILIPIEIGDEEEAWQRLVAVKELLHITDCDRLTAASEAAVDNLFAKFAIPPELRNGAIDGKLGTLSFLNDRVRIYFALAVLVPAKCRDALRALYPEKINDREIAEIAQIPQRYVPTIMSEHFDQAIGELIKFERAAQDAEDKGA